nr:uncharacterized protein LOC125179663 isoform X1 [Anser cygnoides]
MDHFCQQVQQKDVGRRLQVGQELLEYLRDPAASPDVEQDPQRLDRVIDELAAWVNSSNFKEKNKYGNFLLTTAVETSSKYRQNGIPPHMRTHISQQSHDPNAEEDDDLHPRDHQRSDEDPLATGLAVVRRHQDVPLNPELPGYKSRLWRA